MNSNRSQEARVLKVLQDADGAWVSKRYFVQTMMLSQAGRAVYNLENDRKWRERYEGVIEHSEHRDPYRFKYLRLVQSVTEKLFSSY